MRTYSDAAIAAAAGIDYSTFRGWLHRGALRRPRGGWTPEDAILLRCVWVLAVLGIDLRAAIDLCEARRAAITAGRGWLVYLRDPGVEPAVLLVTRPEDLVAVTSHGLLRGPQAGVVTIDLSRSREVVLRALREARSEARVEPQPRREVIA